MRDINLIGSDQIDVQKWDDCIRGSVFENPLAYKWALDSLCGRWMGFVVDGYKAVIPIPIGRKFFFRTAQLPPDVQYFGIFCSADINPSEVLSLFLQEQYLETLRFFLLSFPMVNSGFSSELLIMNRTTYLLHINQPYRVLYSNYSRRHKRNLRHFHETGFSVVRSLDVDAMLGLRSLQGKETYQLFLSKGQFNQRKSFLQEGVSRDVVRIYYVFDSKGEVQGGGVFVLGNQRIVFFMLSSTKLGLNHRSGFAIVDAFIREHQGYEGYIDFFGSDIPSIAEFNRGFGATPTPYYNYLINRWGFCLKRVQKMRVVNRLKTFLR